MGDLIQTGSVETAAANAKFNIVTTDKVREKLIRGATTVTSDASGNITVNSSNTTYSNMTAATASAAGSAGLVPAPAAGKQASFLRGDGTWAVPTDTNTHYTTHLYAGSGSAANAATTNGNTKITLTDDSTVRNSVVIKGTGATTVTSDASGNITINSNNTTYSNMTAATASAAGSAGLVPAPAAGKQASFLRGDGTWAVPTNTTYSVFTGADGTNAGTAGLVPKPAAAANVKFLRGDGTWAAIAGNMLSASSVNANGYIKFGNGLIIQWGTIVSEESSVTVLTKTFPIEFSSKCYAVSFGMQTTRTDSANMGDLTARDITKTQFKYRARPTSEVTCAYWMAIGK